MALPQRTQGVATSQHNSRLVCGNKTIFKDLKNSTPVADLHSKILDARPPWGSKFFHFHAVFGRKNRLAHPLWELAPPWGKSWIRHWLVLPGELAPPPRGNPGSATAPLTLRTQFLFISCRILYILAKIGPPTKKYWIRNLPSESS